MFNYAGLFKEAYQQLLPFYDERESNNILYLLLEDKYGINKRATGAMQGAVSNDKQDEWRADIKRLMNHEPIQYITGVADFLDLKLKVNPNVLIPRPETEELVQLCIKGARTFIKPQILDIGTGSGAIAIAVAKGLPQAVVSAIDINPEAVAIATENAKANKAKVQFSELDFLSPVRTESLAKYNIIISNPPYISAAEKKTMAKNVLNYEPHSALFPEGKDPLVFYKTIAEFAQNHLLPRGLIFMELNASLAKETAEIFMEHNKSVTILKDMQGKERMLRVCRELITTTDLPTLKKGHKPVYK